LTATRSYKLIFIESDMDSSNRHEISHSNGYTSSTRGDIGNHGAEKRKFAGSEQGLTFDEFIEIVNTARSFNKVLVLLCR
jgi:hypothetical protein